MPFNGSFLFLSRMVDDRYLLSGWHRSVRWVVMEVVDGGNNERWPFLFLQSSLLACANETPMVSRLIWWRTRSPRPWTGGH